MTAEAACWCGCSAEAHDHYRPGSDCGECGRAVCAKYLPVPIQRSTEPNVLELTASLLDRVPRPRWSWLTRSGR